MIIKKIVDMTIGNRKYRLIFDKDDDKIVYVELQVAKDVWGSEGYVTIFQTSFDIVREIIQDIIKGVL